MFNLPQEIQRYIYEFCSDKWENMDNVLNQFLKGGFNRINYNIKNFIKNEKKQAIKAANFRSSRKSKVTNWLLNIEKIVYNHREKMSNLIEPDLMIMLINILMEHEFAIVQTNCNVILKHLNIPEIE